MTNAEIVANAAVLVPPIPDFRPFPKIPRLKRDCIITEKIDGTNAVVYVDPQTGLVAAGSRTRWLIGCDNYGFAAWVAKHEEELRRLGPGFHYGEWYGAGIQRAYGLTEKRFALFNGDRYAKQGGPPPCCEVVPVLYRGEFHSDVVDIALGALRTHGSVAVLGFSRPEGVVVYHAASGQSFKVLIENDHMPKGIH